MTGVDLGAVFLNLASDLDDYMAFQNATVLTPAVSKDGDVRTLANGRLRLVSRAGKPKQVDLSMSLCTRAQIDWLEAHVGQLVCVRDDRGRKFYGTYFNLPVQELTARNEYGDSQIQVRQVTHSEAV